MIKIETMLYGLAGILMLLILFMALKAKANTYDCTPPLVVAASEELIVVDGILTLCAVYSDNSQLDVIVRDGSGILSSRPAVNGDMLEFVVGSGSSTGTIRQCLTNTTVCSEELPVAFRFLDSSGIGSPGKPRVLTGN